MEGEGSGERSEVTDEEEGVASADQPAEKEAEPKGAVKPPYSYAQLIVQALLAPQDRRQTLSGIYNFISEKYPFYKLEEKGWKVECNWSVPDIHLVVSRSELHSPQPLSEPVLHEGPQREGGARVWQGGILVHAP